MPELLRCSWNVPWKRCGSVARACCIAPWRRMPRGSLDSMGSACPSIARRISPSIRVLARPKKRLPLLPRQYQMSYDVAMHFRAVMFYCLLAAIVSPAMSAQMAPFTDHGTLKILVDNQLVGTEKFDIEPAGEGYRLKGDLRVKM